MNVTTEQTGLTTAGSAIISGHEGTGARDGLAIRLAYTASPSAKSRVARAVGSGLKAAIQRVTRAARTSNDAATIGLSQERAGVVAEALRAAQSELLVAEEASQTALSAGRLDEASLAPLDRATALKGRIKALSLEASRLASETRRVESLARSSIGRVVVEAVAEVERELAGKIATLEQRILAAVAEDLEQLLAAHALADQLRNSGRKLVEAEAVSAILPRVVDR